ncbi:MAG: Crp/Fnr family transcriptional regulator [Gaiellaceae bacterium]
MDWRLFAGLPEEDVRRLLSVARRRRFERHEVVFHKGDPGDTLHLISKGRFAVRITTQLGETATLTVMAPGDAFGELALVTADHLRSATVIALEPGETYAVHETDLTRLRKQHPGVNEVLITILADRVRQVNERLVEALFVGVEMRVLRRLCDLATLYGDDSGSAAVIPLTQEDIAGLAGTSRATVNRVLREEARRGTVELGRGKTVVVDLTSLKRRAK